MPLGENGGDSIRPLQLEEGNGGGEPLPGPPADPTPRPISDSDLLRAWPIPHVWFYFAGRKHHVVSGEVLFALWGENALSLVREVPAWMLDRMPTGRTISSRAEHDAIVAGYWQPPPPPPAICTPTPTAVAGAEHIDVTVFLAALAHEAEGEIREGMLGGVCAGETILTRVGNPIACKEDWPAIVKSFCFDYVPEEPVGELEPESEESVEVRIAMEKAWVDLMHEGQVNLRYIGSQFHEVAGHLKRIRTSG